MKERHGGIDTYLRRSDTILARGLRRVSPKVGLDYRRSLSKNVAERVASLPSALMSLPLIGVLALSVKLQDGGNSFYTQNRMGENGSVIKTVKIRSMHVDADQDERANEKRVMNPGDNHDSRATKLGGFLRKYGLDELPQLWQVVRGDLALVGIRVNPKLTFDVMRSERPLTYKGWFDAYTAAKPSIFNPVTALHPKIKNQNVRYHMDTFYAKKASLGFDLYLLWRTLTH